MMSGDVTNICYKAVTKLIRNISGIFLFRSSSIFSNSFDNGSAKTTNGSLKLK